MRTVLMCLLAAMSLALGACIVNEAGDDDATEPDPGGDGDGDGDADCVDRAGRWEVEGNCGADLCTFSQATCVITQVSCTSGGRSTDGAIDGNDFEYVGESGGGESARCQGS